MSERIYFDSEKGRIERSDLYLVNLIFKDGQVIENLEPRRLFPVTDTEHYITLLDDKEKEIALIRNMSDLDETSREVLEDCFREYYMIPKITQILEVHDKFGVLEFKVMSNRGEISQISKPLTFLVRRICLIIGSTASGSSPSACVALTPGAKAAENTSVQIVM